MGRLVVTHSTYIDGLLPWLRKISNNIEVKTITPGVIEQAKGKNEGLKLRVSREIVGGYKIIARKGRTIQEVFIITKLSKEKLKALIIKEKPRN